MIVHIGLVASFFVEIDVRVGDLMYVLVNITRCNPAPAFTHSAGRIFLQNRHNVSTRMVYPL